MCHCPDNMFRIRLSLQNEATLKQQITLQVCYTMKTVAVVKDCNVGNIPLSQFFCSPVYGS